MKSIDSLPAAMGYQICDMPTLSILSKPIGKLPPLKSDSAPNLPLI